MKQYGSQVKFRVAGTRWIETRQFFDEPFLPHGERAPSHVVPMLARHEVEKSDGSRFFAPSIPEIGTHWDFHEITPISREV